MKPRNICILLTSVALLIMSNIAFSAGLNNESFVSRNNPPPLTAKSTHTYIRCWYRTSPEPTDPRSNYRWAKKNGTDIKLTGYWWKDGVTHWENMFYTDVSQRSILDLCRNTLEASGVKGYDISFSAADTGLSLDYTIWSEDDSERIVTFGDSLSDIGNMFNATQNRLPNSSSWFNGHFTNGKTWHEYLSNKANLPVYNWAIGGAGAKEYREIPGFIEQLNSFKVYIDKAPHYNIHNTLFTVLFGGNDFVNYNQTADSVLSTVRTGLTKLVQDYGARNVLVLNLPDISITPEAKAKGISGLVKQKVDAYNLGLIKIVSELRNKTQGLNINIFDTNTAFNDILKNSKTYGIVNTTDPCLDIDPKSSGVEIYLRSHAPTTACNDSHGNYIFWDVLHPTTKVHQILADKISNMTRQYFVTPQ